MATELAIGTRLGHYVIVSQLGRGGMGDVYLAHDARLDRRVALKVPRHEVSGSLDRLELFEREARAVAALNHPNIVHLYSVEEVDGLIFMTMELVEGRSLHELLGARKPLSRARVVAIGAQIAEALASAHAAGVLHRDLKPANIMVTEQDRVKILDFGLAKLFRPASLNDADAETHPMELSSSGTTVGTVGYMSPEQALGKAVDARTDVFALGVILYEMATGRRPFTGDTPAAVFDQLLHSRPRSPATLNPALPLWLATLIERALEKDPDRRYRSAQECLVELQQIDPARETAPTATGVSAKDAAPSSIVVLPFVDLSPQHDQEYFCHGITEEIISALAKVSGLRVISRTSAFAFQGKNLDVTEIGRRLRVGTVLEGSVRKAGNSVRITAQLVDADEGYQCWSKRFDRELSDVFAIQDEIATSIVTELQTGLAGPLRRRTPDVAAHDTYLRGMYALNKWTDDSMRRAIADFRAAIAQDAAFAPAYAALAEAQIWLYSGLSVLSARETVPQARWAVEKALELDPTLVDAHKVRGLIAMNHDWDRQGAAEALTRAVQLGPGSPTAHLWNGWRLALLERRADEALVELQEAERLDPLDLQVKTQIGYIHHFHGDADRAIEQFEKVLALEPSFAFGHFALADACVQKGLYDRAFAEFDRASELGGRSVNLIGVLGYAYGRSGNRERAMEHLRELTARTAHVYVPAMWIALVHLGLGNFDSLFGVLDRAFEERDGSLILVTGAAEFDPVREDPRFTSLLGKMGLSHLAAA